MRAVWATFIFSTYINLVQNLGYVVAFYILIIDFTTCKAARVQYVQTTGMVAQSKPFFHPSPEKPFSYLSINYLWGDNRPDGGSAGTVVTHDKLLQRSARPPCQLPEQEPGLRVGGVALVLVRLQHGSLQTQVKVSIICIMHTNVQAIHLITRRYLAI